MQQKSSNQKVAWDEQDSLAFIDYGRYFVPARDEQIATMCDLVPPCAQPCHILDLGCGEGSLAGALLQRLPDCTVQGLDGSPQMLERATANLAQYGERFTTQLVDLAARNWRTPPWPVHAVVSSLAIHHLDDQQKQALYADTYRMLVAGGVLVIADVIEPASAAGTAVAANAWDDAVRQRALALNGTTSAFEFFRQDKWNMYRYPDPIDKPSRLFDHLRWLEAAGFVDVDVWWMQAGHAIYGGRRSPTAE